MVDKCRECNRELKDWNTSIKAIVYGYGKAEIFYKNECICGAVYDMPSKEV